MRTIAIINQKGGCGKTTVSINLAATLALRGHPTLLVDMDPQSHCALGLSVPEAEVKTSTAELIRHGLDGSVNIEDAIWQVSRNLDLVPSNMALAAVEAQLANAPDKDRRLTHVLSAVQDRYEFCIIDCPPSIGLLTFNALRAAGEIVIPVETGYFSMRGAVKQQRTIEMLAQRAGHHAEFMLLPTMYDVRTKLARELLAEIKRQFDDYVLPMVINFNAKLKEAASFGQPITEYDPASRGCADFDRLADHLLAHEPTLTLMGSAQSDYRDPFAAADADAQGSGRPGAAPAMSRAAELAERARALSARTAELSRRLSRDRDLRDEPDLHADVFMPDHATESANRPETDAQPATPAVPRGNGPSPLRFANTQAGAGEGEGEGGETSRGPVDAGTADAPMSRREQQAALARVYGVRLTRQGVLFVQPAVGQLQGASHVAIVGDFNGWSEGASPMKRNEQLGVWQAVVHVPPGRYRYRLVVDGQTAPDPYNEVVEVTDSGQRANVLEIA